MEENWNRKLGNETGRNNTHRLRMSPFKRCDGMFM